MNQTLLYNERELLLQLKAGNGYAFTKIFNHYNKHIYGVALKFLKSPVLAEEIVQDVFLKIWLKRAELQEVRDFGNYLFIMARNFILDRIKKMSYEAELQRVNEPEPTIDDTEYLIRQHQCQQIILDAIDSLSPQQKQVYHFAKKEELSHAAIAERMGISRLTVKTHMAKALQCIRKYVDSHLYHMPLLPFIAALSIAI